MTDFCRPSPSLCIYAYPIRSARFFPEPLVSQLHKFIFDGLPVRGMLVQLTDTWTEILRRRASNTQHGAYPTPLRDMLGQMTAAATLMQSNIKFDGSLTMQIMGDGPVKLAVVEVQPDLALRATATLIGVVPLFDDHGQPIERLSEVLEHYMLQSEQLDTTLVLAADANMAAGLLIQRLPVQGAGNLEGSMVSRENEDAIGRDEDYQRIAILAKTLQSEELLTLDADTILRRLFWEESITRFEPLQGASGPRFACSCSRERVARMIVSLGADEAHSVIEERGELEVACEFCGVQYRFDPVDTAQLFVDPTRQGAPGSSAH